jgi:hypothetical protein
MDAVDVVGFPYLRQNHLESRVFETYDAIADADRHTCNSLIAQRDQIALIATREWAAPVDA